MSLFRLFLSILATLLLVLPSAHSQEWYEADKPHFLNTESIFSAMKTPHSIKIIKFFSPWCSQCRFIKAYLQSWKNSHQKSSNILFYDFNCQANGPLFCAEHFKVRSYPAVIFVNQKGQIMSRIDGLYPEGVIISLLNQYDDMAKSLQGKQEHKSDKNGLKSQQKRPILEQIEFERQQKVQNELNKEEKMDRNENLVKSSELNKKIRPILQGTQQVQQKPISVSQIPSLSKYVVEAQNTSLNRLSEAEKTLSQELSKTGAVQNPSNSQTQLFGSKQQLLVTLNSSTILKYVLYLCGAGIGLLYVYHIYIQKFDFDHEYHENFDSQAHLGQQRFSFKSSGHAIATNRDIEKDILTQEIRDQI